MMQVTYRATLQVKHIPQTLQRPTHKNHLREELALPNAQATFTRWTEYFPKFKHSKTLPGFLQQGVWQNTG